VIARTRLSAYLFVVFALSFVPVLLAHQADHDGPVSQTDPPLLPFPNAPFSAEAVTTVNQMLRNGTRLEQSTTARYYRDSVGRVRVELLMEGLRQPNTMSERHIRLMVCPFAREFPDVPEPKCYTLDPVTRAKRVGISWLLPLTKDGHFIGVPVGGVRFLHFDRAQDILRYEPQMADTIQHEPLGRRRIAGVDTIGERTSLTIPALVRPRNPAPLRFVDEVWTSADLGLVIYARYSDSKGGFIEYRLQNIRRDEPSPDLFIIPADYNMAADSGSREDPVYSSQDGRWVADALAWSVER